MKTLKQKIADIRAACIAANPSITDLVFGCRIKDWKKGEAIIVGVEKYSNGESDCYYQFYNKIPHPIMELSPYHNWEIIGRPIRLADVLLAVTQIPRIKMFSQAVIMGAEEPRKIAEIWDLRNDDLTKQSPKTIDFIHNLLCPAL